MTKGDPVEIDFERSHQSTRQRQRIDDTPHASRIDIREIIVVYDPLAEILLILQSLRNCPTHASRTRSAFGQGQIRAVHRIRSSALQKKEINSRFTPMSRAKKPPEPSYERAPSCPCDFWSIVRAIFVWPNFVNKTACGLNFSNNHIRLNPFL